MSASEKLKALKAPRYGIDPHELAAVYPQIVAVVEAAEREAAELDQEFMDDADLEAIPPWQGFANLHSALSALDEALS